MATKRGHTGKFGKNHPCSKRIKAINVSTKKEKTFNSVSECAKKLGLYQSNISLVLNGTNRSTGGYRFEYVDVITHIEMSPWQRNLSNKMKPIE